MMSISSRPQVPPSPPWGLSAATATRGLAKPAFFRSDGQAFLIQSPRRRFDDVDLLAAAGAAIAAMGIERCHRDAGIGEARLFQIGWAGFFDSIPAPPVR